MVRQAVALMTVEKDGQPYGTITTQKQLFERWEQSPITKVGIRQTFMEDLYLILDVEDLGAAFDNEAQAQRVTFTVQVNVLVGWIWNGGFIVTLGGLIGLWPSRGSSTPTPRPQPREKRTALAARG